MYEYTNNGTELPNLKNAADFGPLDPGNGLAGLSPVRQNPEDAASGKVNVIYCRFSSDMQRKESNENQARHCREHLQRSGLGHLPFVVINDEEVSGTTLDRPGWQRVMELIRGRRLGILIVFEVSRMDRGDKAMSFVRDIDFREGRFISSSECIDSDHEGWENLVRMAGMQASSASGFTARRVYIAQEGLARTPNRSAGDGCYGYRSEFVDSEAERAVSRQRHFRKQFVIDRAAADVVVMVFDWFVEGGLGISQILRKLVELRDTIPVPGRADRRAWNRDIVRRMLSRRKYRGEWVWGLTRTVRDSNGNKSHVPAKVKNVVYTARPELAIIDPDVFDRAQVILQAFKDARGNQPGGGKRGPAMHYRLMHTGSLVMGLLYCSGCGTRLHVSGGSPGKVRLACPNNHDRMVCDHNVGLLLTVAEARVAEAIGHALAADRAWLPAIMGLMADAVAVASAEIPTERAKLMAAKAEVDHKVQSTAEGVTLGVGVKALVDILVRLEAQQRDLEARLARLGPIPDPRALPDEAWVRGKLDDLYGLLKAADPVMLGIFRRMIGRIEVDPVIAPGRKRGYARLRFTLNLPGVADALLRRQMPPGVSAVVPPLTAAGGVVELTVDLNSPSKADLAAPQIYAWRQETPPVSWNEIGRRTGLPTTTCATAFGRYHDSPGDDPHIA